MTPRHHLPDDMVLGYGAGSLPYAEALLVATHLALCPACRDLSDRADAVGGALLESAPHGRLPDDLLDRVLARLDPRLEEPEPPAAPLAPPERPPRIPMPLRQHTGPLAAVRWQWRAPGLETSDVGVSHQGTPVRLFRLSPGAVPGHTHVGLERGLVLTGGFTDDEGHYTRGDVSIRDGSSDHHAVIDDGDWCVVLFVNDAPLVPRSWKFRLASPWVRV